MTHFLKPRSKNEAGTKQEGLKNTARKDDRARERASVKSRDHLEEEEKTFLLQFYSSTVHALPAEPALMRALSAPLDLSSFLPFDLLTSLLSLRLRMTTQFLVRHFPLPLVAPYIRSPLRGRGSRSVGGLADRKPVLITLFPVCFHVMIIPLSPPSLSLHNFVTNDAPSSSTIYKPAGNRPEENISN